jgi:hypothetical protein
MLKKMVSGCRVSIGLGSLAARETPRKRAAANKDFMIKNYHFSVVELRSWLVKGGSEEWVVSYL